MVRRNYLIAWIVGLALWSASLLTFTWVIDPYGVWRTWGPWPRVNELKPKRRDIDRALKPFEVWKYQPRTVFLGSSRVHEAFDPSVLDGTRYAPAYNAAIPANTLSLNTAHLHQYIQIDRSLKFALVELFFWDFIYNQPLDEKKTWGDFLRGSAPLFVSGTSLSDAVATLRFNRGKRSPPAHVSPRGHWVYQSGQNPQALFDLYTDSIMKVHQNLPHFILQPLAFRWMERLVEVCRQHGVEVHFFITPSHPYEDYRLLSLGFWPLLEDWHRQIAGLPNVLSFSQYTPMVTEPISSNMVYWNDPLHPSVRFGDLMLRAFRGDTGPDIPPETLLRVNGATVEEVLRKRREGLETWILANRDFTEAFDRAKVASGNSPSQREAKKR